LAAFAVRGETFTAAASFFAGDAIAADSQSTCLTGQHTLTVLQIILISPERATLLATRRRSTLHACGGRIAGHTEVFQRITVETS